VFVDCQPDTALIDVPVESAITDKTRAIIPSTLRAARDMDATPRSPAPRLAVVEDAWQAHGAR
jgi:dTDP-4-amino-4,6-dideoxygalactose transaminase